MLKSLISFRRLSQAGHIRPHLIVAGLTLAVACAALGAGCSSSDDDSSAESSTESPSGAESADSGDATPSFGFPDTTGSDDGDEPVDGEDATQPVDGTPESDLAEMDVDDAGPDPDPCGGVSCAEGERLVGCECVVAFDRRCLTDADCRPDEICQRFVDTSICWWEPPDVRVCPGGEGCAAPDAAAPVRAGAATRVVTLDGFETPLPEGLDGWKLLSGPDVEEGHWRDCGYDDLCPGDPGYAGPDEGEADGQMQGMWIAGFTFGRPAQKCPPELVGCDAPECCVSEWAHDDIRVQVAVVEQGDVRVAFASLDTVGFFHSDVEDIRRAIDPSLGIDLFIMAATHNHEGPDTAGQWGPGGELPERNGVDPKFLAKIKSQTVSGIEEAVAELEEVDLHAAVLDVGVEGMAMSDSRTPYIFDDNVPVVRMVSKATGQGVATLLSFANHPEVLWSGNTLITSDYPHYVRKYVREGLPVIPDGQGGVIAPALGGFGGVVVFFVGSVGGLIYPGKGYAVTHGGEILEEHSFRMADAVGQSLAKKVLNAWYQGGFDPVESDGIRFATKRYLTGVGNKTFQLAGLLLGILKRDMYNVTTVGFLEFLPALPQIQSQTAIVELGPITFFTGPGEVFPETLVGGTPGRPSTETPVIGDVLEHRTPAVCGPDGLPTAEGEPAGSTACVVKPTQNNPPNWEAAPQPPYGYDWVQGEYKFFIGLGMDFLGYMVPSYDFAVNDTGLSWDEASGDHYEETNGVGADSLADWIQAIQQCSEALNGQ